MARKDVCDQNGTGQLWPKILYGNCYQTISFYLLRHMKEYAIALIINEADITVKTIYSCHKKVANENFTEVILKLL